MDASGVDPVPSLTPTAGTVNKPVLHIEARIKTDNTLIISTELIRDQLIKWLTRNFAVLSLGQEITAFDDYDNSNASELKQIASVKVVECTGTEQESGVYSLDEVDLDVQSYQLRYSEADFEQSDGSSEKGGDATPQARITRLPSKELDGIWESLLFDTPIASNLLRAVSRLLTFSSKLLNTWTINWNRLVLLYGPPGTGKTSLCRALAQKLAIRQGTQFPQTQLVEINANSLGSKYFHESGKLVAKMFDNIEDMLDDDPDTFICVFIDEVETLTARREKTVNGNEPNDAMRAVNAMLTALDRLRHRPNVVVLCTSNLITALDSAFLDRVDIKQFVPHPSPKVIYEIYRSCLEYLAKCELIKGATFDVVQEDPESPKSPLKYISTPADELVLPRYSDMWLWYQLFPESIPKQLFAIAELSAGLSGRTLRRLPALSLVLHSNKTKCTIDEALAALKRGVEAENRSKEEAGSRESSSDINNIKN